MDKKIVIYPEPEILFHLAGYNGEVFKRLTEDLFSLISEMNSKNGKHALKIKYFKETTTEIEKFFTKAENIVKGNDIAACDNFAMNTIINGCQNASDVVERKGDFYRLLKSKGIVEADEYNYYADTNYVYNLESVDSMEKYGITEDKLRYITHLNYVNILRKGNEEKDLKNTEHIVLTEVGKMLRISQEIAERKIPLAINMNSLTNRLWYDLNKGFGAKEFPASFDIILKSKIVLSSLISQSVSQKYDDAYAEYKNNNIDSEHMADAIITLREEAKKPEDINETEVDKILAFISEDTLNIYQSEKERLDSTVKIKEQELEQVKQMLELKEINISENKLKEAEWSEEKQQLLKNEKNAKRERFNDIESRKIEVDNQINIKTRRLSKMIKFMIVVYYLLILLIYLIIDDNKKNILIGCLTIIPPAIAGIYMFISNRNLNLLEVVNSICSRYSENKIQSLYRKYQINMADYEKLKEELKGDF